VVLLTCGHAIGQDLGGLQELFSLIMRAKADCALVAVPVATIWG